MVPLGQDPVGLTMWPGSSRGQGWSSMGDTTVCVYSVISARVVTTLHTHPEKCGDPQGRSVWWQAVRTMLCLCGGGPVS